MKRIFSALGMAFGMYTIIPVPLKKWDEAARPLMLVFLPVVGLAVGALWYGLMLLLRFLHFPEALLAAILTVYPYRITGFIHLDGYMDCCDAILSYQPLEEKQRVLKDSHVGAFAVISLAMLLLLCFAFFLSQPETAAIEALIFIPSCARCISAICVFNLKPMAHSQFAGGFGKEKKKVHSLSLAALLLLSLAGAFALGGFAALLSAAVAAAGCFLAILYARARLGGMSGDVAGYGTVIGEAAALAVMIVNI